MVQNGRGNNSRMANGRKRKQFNNKVNAKKFKPNYRNNNGGQGSNGPRDQQRDFARDYIDFETFDDFNDSSSRSFYPPQQRPMNMVPVIPPYPYRDTRPLLPLPPVPPMYGPGPGPRRPNYPPPMPPPHMRRMGPPMPMMPPRPLLPRPPPAAYIMRPFGPPGPMRPPRPGMGPRHGQRLMGRGHQGNRGGKRPGQKQNNNKGNNKKQKKKGGKKITPTPPQELNDMTKPWITDEIREANAKKIELNKLASKAATPDPELWKEFWQAREKVKAMVQAARLEYIGSHPEEDVDKILSEAKTKGEGQNGDAVEIKTESGETKIGNVVSLSQSFVKTETLHTVKSETDSDNIAENGGGDKVTVTDSCDIKTEPVDAPNQGQGDQAAVSEVVKNTSVAQATVAKQVIKQPPQTPTKAAVKAPPAPVQQIGQAQISKVIPKVQTPQAKPAQGVKPTPAAPNKPTPPATVQAKLTPAVQSKTVTTAQSKPVAAATAIKPTTAAPTTQAAKPVAAVAKAATAAAVAVVKAATPAAAVVKPATPAAAVVKAVTPAATAAAAVAKVATPAAVAKPATPAATVAKATTPAVSTPAKVVPVVAKVATPAANVVPATTAATANVVPAVVVASTEQPKPATASTPNKPAVATPGAQPKAAAAVTPAPKAQTPVQNKPPQNKPQTGNRGRGGARGGQFNNRGGRANPYNTRTRMTSNDGYNKRGYY